MPHQCAHDAHEDDHSHSHTDDIEPALQSLLYQQVEFDRITTLNEQEVGSGKLIVQKAWQDRLSRTPILSSDSDEQLLVFIPFAGMVKLHSILIRTEDTTASPCTLKIFHNRDDLDFSTIADMQPTQTLLVSRTNEVQELPVKRSLFNSTHSLTLFFEDNFGSATGDDVKSRVYWLGFKGEFRQVHREAVEVLYEKAANPKDHKMITGIGDASASRQGM